MTFLRCAHVEFMEQDDRVLPKLPEAHCAACHASVRVVAMVTTNIPSLGQTFLSVKDSFLTDWHGVVLGGS